MKKNLIIAVLACLLAAFILNEIFGFFHLNKAERLQKETAKVEKSGKYLDQENPAKISVAKDSTTHAVKSIKQTESAQNTLMPATQKVMNEEILPVMERQHRELVEYDKVKAVISGEVKATTIIINNQAFKITYNQGRMKAVAERDSLGVVKPLKYAYDAEITRVRSKPKPVLILWKKDDVTDDWSSPDKDFKINGVEHFSQKVEYPKSFFQLQAESQMQFGLKDRNNSQVSAGLNGVFNADGFFSPSIGVGKIWNLSNGAADTYLKIGTTFSIANFRK